jgi:hypothetical protein
MRAKIYHEGIGERKATDDDGLGGEPDRSRERSYLASATSYFLAIVRIWCASARFQPAIHCSRRATFHIVARPHAILV